MAPIHASDAPDRTQLQQIIAGVTEGVVLVEPDGRITYANDAALEMHGAFSTEELGGTVDAYASLFTFRYRSGAPVPPGELHLQRLLAGEAFDGVIYEVRRVDDPEADWVHRSRGFVLNDGGGQPDVLVLVLDDATDAFEAEERFERMFNANPAPALIVRVSDLRYVRVNQGFLEMTGHQADQIVGRSIYEMDVLSEVEEREIQAARVTGWQTVPQMEAELPLPGGGSRLVIVAGHPIEIADEQCMLFTFADLEPRRRAERALQQSEERFAKAFRLAPAPMLILSLDGFRLLNVNRAFLQLTGWTLEEVVGRTPQEMGLWTGAGPRGDAERRVVESGGFRELSLQFRTKSGATLDVLASAESVSLRSEASVLMVLQDVTERRRSEAELAEAIEAALRDTDWLSRRVLDRLAAMRRASGGPLADGAELTPREAEVLALVAQGRSDGEIAGALSLTRNTVRNHLARVYGKIGAHSRSEAVIWARERNLNSKADVR
jgi:PAS domain S-box-containing protein